MAPSEKEKLKREIGVRSLTLAILNMTVGTGIFILPAIIAENLGTAAIIAYLVCGTIIFLIALCFAEVGSRFTTSGGTYTYIEAAFGPFAGFIANNIFWLGSCVISDAAVASALADTMKLFIPSFANGFFRATFLILVFGGLALINIRSVKSGVRFIEFSAFGKLIPLVLLTVAGIAFVSTNNLRWTAVPAIGNIGETSLILIYAFIGMETPVTNGGEIKNPRRTVPLGVLFGVVSVLVLYISIQLVTQGILGENILTYKEAPLSAAARIISGRTGAIIIIVAMVISMLGNIGGEILGIPRILYAGARDGLMPKQLGKIHPKFLTPHIAIAFYALLGCLFAISGGFRQLAIIASAATLLIYFGVVLATIKLKKSNSVNTEKTFRIPGGIVIPVLAACAIIWLLLNLKWQEFLGIGIFIFVFSIIYLFIKRVKKEKLISKTQLIAETE